MKFGGLLESNELRRIAGKGQPDDVGGCKYGVEQAVVATLATQ